MASSEQLAAIDPWMFRSVLSDSWISESYARDTDALTNALQHSLSSDSSPSYLGGLVIKPDANTSSLSSLQTPSGSGSDLDTAVPRRRNAAAPGSTSVTGGKIAKRKSRASKRNTTTFINADPANFRQMVQEVTGVRFGGNGHVPVSSNAPLLLKPEPQRASFDRLHGGCLPTLDTSAFLLDHHQVAGPSSTTVTQQGMVADGGSGFDFESFSSFPTLESWK